MDDPSAKKDKHLWMGVAAQAMYIIAFGGLMGVIAPLIAGLTGGFTAASALTIGIGAAIGLAGSIGNIVLTNKMEEYKKAESQPAERRAPVVLVMAEPNQSVQKQFAAAIKAERAAQLEGSAGRGM